MQDDIQPEDIQWCSPNAKAVYDSWLEIVAKMDADWRKRVEGRQTATEIVNALTLNDYEAYREQRARAVMEAVKIYSGYTMPGRMVLPRSAMEG